MIHNSTFILSMRLFSQKSIKQVDAQKSFIFVLTILMDVYRSQCIFSPRIHIVAMNREALCSERINNNNGLKYARHAFIEWRFYVYARLTLYWRQSQTSDNINEKNQYKRVCSFKPVPKINHLHVLAYGQSQGLVLTTSCAWTFFFVENLHFYLINSWSMFFKFTHAHYLH